MTYDQPPKEPTPESTVDAALDVEPPENTDALFPIVGIAASAGGLEAFTELLKHLVTDTGMAFVLIQHLAPNHKSLLSEILARTTKMPVTEVQDGMTVEPNRVYIIPPNTKMILSGGALQLMPREKVQGKYMPADAFFISLAADRGRKAIAVVLSGADGDGSLGLNLDLISCRNVLIYLDATLQKRILPIFHYSLNQTGFLLLGTSESTGNYSDLFTLIDGKYKIYGKKLVAIRPTFSFVTSNYPMAKLYKPTPTNDNSSDGFDLERKTDQLILNRYAPVGVVINNKMEVLQFRGEIDLYLKLAPGKASLNLFKMVRPGLLVELRATIYQAQRQKILVRKEGLQFESGDVSKIINLEVIPFKPATGEELHFLVLFEQAPPTVSNLSSLNPEIPQQGDIEREIVRLKQELTTAKVEQAATQEYLQAVIQEQEHINQDLKVANEEILSSNEKLQSTNEELETAKEEIQSTNEELNTTNEELRSRNRELQQVNNDLTNLLASINIPILMLTNDLRIRRFTPMAQRLFNFIAADAGRPLSDIRANLNIPDLEALILEVLDTLSIQELEVQTLGGHWYNLRIRPYRTKENLIDGVVLVLIDIDVLKRSAATLEQARNYAQGIVETVQVPLIVLDSDFRVTQANLSFYETFQVSPSETVQSLIFELGNGQWNLPELRSLLEHIITNDTTIDNLEIEHRFERIGQKTILLNGWKIIQEGNAQIILLAIEDITDRKQFELERSQLLAQEQSAREQAEIANSAKDELLSNLSYQLRNPLNNILSWAQFFRTRNLDSSGVTHVLAEIEQSARVQAQLIDHLLDISQITDGNIRLNTHSEPSLLSGTVDTLDGNIASLTLENLCILVVDDQADSSDLIKWILEDFGAEVVIVTSAREAIASLTASGRRYNVLLADILMLESDGLSLIRQVRALDVETGGQIPAVAITAYVSEAEQQMLIDAGFQMHLAKPINPTQLALMIANLSGRVADNF